jgi:G3E family GTPase
MLASDLLKPIPTTIITGFLGSGKTTLLKRILTERHGQRIAVIENEFGEVGIDNEILIESTDLQIVEMNNGCICCTVRGDLSRILTDLARKRAAGELRFERVMIETTGLAKPAPVVQTFFMDTAVRSCYRLDGIITLVDAKHAQEQLDRNREAQEQVGFADRLLLSKTDLVPPDDEQRLRHRLARMNPRAQIARVNFGDVPIAQVLDITCFNLNAVLEVSPDFLAAESTAHGPAGHECDEACGHDHPHKRHTHGDAITSFVLRTDRAIDARKFEVFLRAMMDLYATDMMRYKGVINFHQAEQRFIFQGVHMVIGATPGREWSRDEKRESVLVFIGRDLPRDLFEREFARCVVK